jgi:hypothetical protein
MFFALPFLCPIVYTPHLVVSYDTQGGMGSYSSPDPHGTKYADWRWTSFFIYLFEIQQWEVTINGNYLKNQPKLQSFDIYSETDMGFKQWKQGHFMFT